MDLAIILAISHSQTLQANILNYFLQLPLLKSIYIPQADYISYITKIDILLTGTHSCLKMFSIVAIYQLLCSILNFFQCIGISLISTIQNKNSQHFGIPFVSAFSDTRTSPKAFTRFELISILIPLRSSLVYQPCNCCIILLFTKFGFYNYIVGLSIHILLTFGWTRTFPIDSFALILL